MNKYNIMLIIAAGAIVLSNEVQATSFTLEYKGDNEITLDLWGLDFTMHTYTLNAKKRTQPIDTQGFKNITWVELSKMANGQTMEKMFKIEFERDIGFLNVGGRLTISNDGGYNYYFGVDGHGEGKIDKLHERIK